MKIIQANKYYYMRGGAERYLFDLSAWLCAQGHSIAPFAMKSEHNLPTAFDRTFVSEVQTSNFPSLRSQIKTFARMLYSAEAHRHMRRLILDFKPDLCHVHNLYTQLSPSILEALHDAHVPMVMTVHDHHLISPQYNIWVEGCGEDYRDVGLLQGTRSRFHKGSYAGSFAQVFTYLLQRSWRIYERSINFFVCPSNYIKQQLIRGGFPREKIRVNAYGFDATRVTPRYQHEGYMLFVGRLSEEKGVQTVIHIAKALPDIAFKIVGRGPSMEHLHRLAIGTSNISFLGFQEGDALAELYAGACAVLIPSRVHEVFPLTILEAMAAGKPVIASHVGGIPEVVEDHVTGILAHPNDMQAWMEAVMRMSYDEALQDQFSHNARALLETKFRLDDHYRRLLNIYQECGVR